MLIYISRKDGKLRLSLNPTQDTVKSVDIYIPFLCTNCIETDIDAMLFDSERFSHTCYLFVSDEGDSFRLSFKEPWYFPDFGEMEIGEVRIPY